MGLTDTADDQGILVMTRISEDQASARLSGLIDLALQGEEVIITRHEQAVMQLVPVSGSAAPEKKRSKFGCGRGTVIYMAPDFDAPMEDFRGYME